MLFCTVVKDSAHWPIAHNQTLCTCTYSMSNSADWPIAHNHIPCVVHAIYLQSASRTKSCKCIHGHVHMWLHDCVDTRPHAHGYMATGQMLGTALCLTKTDPALCPIAHKQIMIIDPLHKISSTQWPIAHNDLKGTHARDFIVRFSHFLATFNNTGCERYCRPIFEIYKNKYSDITVKNLNMM